MRKFLSLLVALLTVFNSQAAGVIKVNGEEIKKTPTLITLDYSKAGYIQVQFSDSSVVSYNMNLFISRDMSVMSSTWKVLPLEQRLLFIQQMVNRNILESRMARICLLTCRI